jgi:sucrose-6-phosphate hydrolase SacC (GH32 family)
LFQEVFYSKKSTWKGKQFAKAFRKRYPSVWQLIKRMKNEIKNKNRNAIREAKTMVDKKKAEKETENNNIANVMMKLESDIFQKILMRLYKKRNCHVLSIHDAIVMLDTKSSNKYTDEDVRKVILQVYKRYNLSPSLSVDTFNPTKWHEEIKIQKDNQPQIDKKITELRELAKQNDEKAQEILLLIDKGEVEIILNENKKLFFHRLFANNLNDKTIKGKYKAIQIANYEYA